MLDNSETRGNNPIQSMSEYDCLEFDSNGNDQEHFDYDMEFLHSTTVKDPDSLSMISDFSEMGLQIKQSVKFSDMIMSTYSDLKNPSKSITLAPQNKPDPDIAFRKYNMLNLALEFSRWKDCQTDLSICEPLSNNDIQLQKEDSIDDTVMGSTSPSILSDFSSLDQCLEGSDSRLEIPSAMIHSDTLKSPLQIHIDQKFDTCFPTDRFSSDSESCDENNEPSYNSKITRPAWAKTMFHRDTLTKMPKSIRDFTSSISGFDLSKDKYLWMLNISQLQLVMNNIMTQIEELNESLVIALIARDELKSEQMNLVVNVENLTVKARNLAQYWKYSGNRSTQIAHNQQQLGPINKFFSGLLCSPRATTTRFLSFFTQIAANKTPKPEYV